MDEKFVRLIRAAKAVREAYPRGTIGPDQMPPGAVANRLMDELEAATTNAIDGEDNVGAPAHLDRSDKITRWMALRDEVGKVFERYAECSPGGKLEWKEAELQFSFNHLRLLPIFEAYLNVDEDFLTGEFDPQFWQGHDSACHGLFDVLWKAIRNGERGNHSSPELNTLLDLIIELRNKK
jgi:hypothetical protein